MYQVKAKYFTVKLENKLLIKVPAKILALVYVPL